MFDFDAGKLLIIGIVALIVIGPKDLPRVLHQLGEAVGKMRRIAADFRWQFMEAMRETELENLHEEVKEIKQSAFGSVQSVHQEITNALTDRPEVSDREPQTGPEPHPLQETDKAGASLSAAEIPIDQEQKTPAPFTQEEKISPTPHHDRNNSDSL